MPNAKLETITIPGTSLKPTRVALGTWAIGGWMWGGSDDADSIRTIQSALDRGINIIDTAPVYGFGHSEEIVGRALAESGQRQNVIIATKVGARLEKRQAIPQCQQGADRQRDRGFAAPPAHRRHRHLSGPLAGSEHADRRDRRGARRALQGRQDPRDRRQQFQYGADGGVPRRRAAAHRAAALQSLRARSRSGCAALLRRSQDRNARLWCALPRPAQRQDDTRQQIHRRRPAPQRSQIPSPAFRRNISPRSHGSTNSPGRIMASGSCIWRCAGCSTSSR